jgi:hypothetical protein
MFLIFIHRNKTVTRGGLTFKSQHLKITMCDLEGTSIVNLWIDEIKEVEERCDDASVCDAIQSPVCGFKSMFNEEEACHDSWLWGEDDAPATPTRVSPLPMESPVLKAHPPLTLQTLTPLTMEPLTPLTLQTLTPLTPLTMESPSPVLGSKRPASDELWPVSDELWPALDFCMECLDEGFCTYHPMPIPPHELVEPTIKFTPSPTSKLRLDNLVAAFVPTQVPDTPNCGTARPFVCHCGESYQSYGGLKRHRVYWHADQTDPQVIMLKHKMIVTANARTPQVFKCPGCTDTFSKRAPLFAHFVAKHDANAIEADILNAATAARRKSLKLAGAPGRYKKTKSSVQ